MPVTVHPAPANGTSPAVPKAVGRWYNQLQGGSLGTRGGVQDILFLSPIVVDRTLTLTDMGFEVTTAAASAVERFGVYDDEGGVPTNLLLDAGTVACDTTGVKTIAGLSLNLSAGVYWLAAVNQVAAITYRALIDLNPHVGNAFAASATHHSSLFVGSVTGVLPATITSLSWTFSPPQIGVKFA